MICPLCGSQMEYEEASEDIGILIDTYVCMDCGHFQAADDEECRDDADGNPNYMGQH